MSDINITYDLLFDILRYEKSRDDLQKLDDKFYQDVAEYLRSKEEYMISLNISTSEREVTRIQLSNVKKLLSELYERREKKIINLALYKVKTGSELSALQNLLPEEKVLFDSVFSFLSRFRSGTLDRVLAGMNVQNSNLLVSESRFDSKIRTDSTAPNLDLIDYKDIISVRFIKSVPKFLGPELETYGPFEENDIASMPKILASILIHKNRAEELKIQ